MDVWLNTSTDLFNYFWKVIQSSYANDYKKHSKFLEVESVITMMETMANSRMTQMQSEENYCCSKEHKFSLDVFLTPMTTFVKFAIICQPTLAQVYTKKLINSIRKQPCHCLFLCLIKLLKDLCDSDIRYAKELILVKGLEYIFHTASDYGIDIKLNCINLMCVCLDQAKKNKLALKQTSSDLVKFAFHFFKNLNVETSREGTLKSSENSSGSFGRGPRPRGKSLKKSKIKAVGTPQMSYIGSFNEKPLIEFGRSTSKNQLEKASSNGPANQMLEENKLQSVKNPQTGAEFTKASSVIGNVHQEGELTTEAFTLYNTLLLWAVGINPNKPENNWINLNAAINLKEIGQKEKNQEVTILNGEAVSLLVQFCKKGKSTKLKRKLIKDISVLVKYRPENKRSLLLHDTFMIWLVNLECELHSLLKITIEYATLSMYKKTAHLLANIICEGLQYPTTISSLLKFLLSFPHFAESKISSCKENQCSSSSKASLFIWWSILNEYNNLLSIHKPMTSTLIIWQNLPLIVVNSAKFCAAILFKEKASQEIQPINEKNNQNKEIDMIHITPLEIKEALFEVLNCFWTHDLFFILNQEGHVNYQEVLEKNGIILLKTYSQYLIQEVKILNINIKDDSSASKNSKNMNMATALSYLLSMGIMYDINPIRLISWVKSAEITIVYFLFIIEFSKLSGDNGTIKSLNKPLLTLLITLLSQRLLKSNANILNESLAKIIRITLAFVQVFHGATQDFYKKYFVVLNGKLLFPLESLSSILKAKAEDLIAVLDFEQKNLFQSHSDVAKIGDLIDNTQEDIWRDCKNYCTEFMESKFRQKQKILDSERSLQEEAIKKSKVSQSGVIEDQLKYDIGIKRRNFKWLRIQKKLKQWQGVWRNRDIFDSNSKVRIPLKFSSHIFANGNRCLMKIRSKRCKYMDKKQYPNCFEENPRPDSFFYQLTQTTSIPDESAWSKQEFSFYAVGHLKQTDLDTKIASFLYNNMQLETRDGLFAPLDCEIYSNICAKKGKLLLYLPSLSKSYIVFVSTSNMETVEDGRLMYVHHPLDGAYLLNKWKLKEIITICHKQIVDTRTAVEIVLSGGRSKLLNFSQESNAELFCKKLVKLKGTRCINLKHNDNFDNAKSLEKSKFTENWVSWKISTFDYLLALNHFSSRSFHNLSQYPVFPWIITDCFSGSILIEDQKFYRDLTKNLGTGGNKERAEECKNRYLSPDCGQGHFHFGSHYSNPGIVFQFMMRVFPIFEAYVKFFTGLDSPNRMFHSIPESWRSAQKDQGDVRELIPEFFSFPEIFFNREQLAFGEREDDKQKVDNVLLPAWAKSNPYLYVAIMREALESNVVSKQISGWIDLIFGYQQRGKEAEKACNVFPPLCYEAPKVIMKLKGEEKEAFRMQAFQYGQTPQQLFTKCHPERIIRNPDGIYLLCDQKSIMRQYIINRLFSQSQPTERVIYIKPKDDTVAENRFILITFNGTIIKATLDKTREYENEEDEKNTSKICLNTIVSHFKTNYVTEKGWNLLDPDISYNFPIHLIEKRNYSYIIQGGFIDGTIQITNFEKVDAQQTIKVASSTIMSLAVDQEGIYVYAGTKNGECLVFQANENTSLTQKDYLFDHKDSINYIHIAENMNLFITASADSTANIYTLSYNPKLIRTIYHKSYISWDFVSLHIIYNIGAFSC